VSFNNKDAYPWILQAAKIFPSDNMTVIAALPTELQPGGSYMRVSPTNFYVDPLNILVSFQQQDFVWGWNITITFTQGTTAHHVELLRGGNRVFKNESWDFNKFYQIIGDHYVYELSCMLDYDV
jgi:hypothetical protein